MGPVFTLNFQTNHRVGFILPLYGFLLISTLAKSLKTSALSVITQRYSFLFMADFKKLMLRKVNKSFQFKQRFFNLSPDTQPNTYKPFNNSTTTQGNSLLGYFHKTYRTMSQTWLNIPRKNYYEDVTIKRIKFKPGYSRLWRLARTALKFLLTLKFQYQKKLTRYITSFFRINRRSVLKYNELKLIHVLTTIQFVPDKENALLLLQNNLVFLNGTLVSNPRIFLIKADFLQLLISLKYYVLFK